MTTPLTEVAPVTYQAIRNQSGFLIIQRGSGTVNVYNGDITNVLLVSDNPSPGVSNSIPVQPLTNALFDSSKKSYYASAVPGQTVATATVSLAQLSPSPAQIALQIAAQGLAKDTTVAATNTVLGSGIALPVGAAKDVTVVDVHTAVTAQTGAGNTIGQDVAQNGTFTLRSGNSIASAVSNILGPSSSTNLVTAFATSQQSYAMSIELLFPLGATNPFAEVLFSFSDAATGTLTDSYNIFLPGGNNANNIFTIRGPITGDTLNILLENQDPTLNLSYTFGIIQSSTEFSRMRASEIFSQGVAGFTRPGIDGTVGTLGSFSSNINAGATAPARLCAVWAGESQLTIDNTAGGSTLQVTVTDPQSLYSLGGTKSFGTFVVPANGSLSETIPLPNGPVALLMKNTGGAAITPTVDLIRIDH